MPRRSRRPHVRPKTIRRLLILATIAGLTGGSVGVAYWVHGRNLDAAVMANRTAGLAAFERGDFAAAAPALRQAVAARPQDVDVLFALARAELSIDAQSRTALLDARGRLEQLRRVDPAHQGAQHALLDLYERAGLSRELLDLAEAMLSGNPTDAAALRGRALALSRLERDRDALPAWQAYVAATPADVRGQLQLIAAMQRAGDSPEVLVAHARALADANGDDPRFRLPLAEVLREAGREAEALTLLRALAEHPPTDTATLVELVNALDRARAYDDAERLLIRAADTLRTSADSSVVSGALVQRVWQAGRMQQVIELTDRLLTSGRRDASVLALRAVALATANRRAEALPLITELAGRKQDPAARAWTDALSVEFGTSADTPAARVQALRSATQRDPANAIARLWLARALAGVGETDAAAAQYRETAQRVPSWATPCIELADLLRSAGRTGDAIAAAKAALLRAPTSAVAQVTAARVRFDALDGASDPGEAAALLSFVVALRQQLPEEPTLAAIHVAMLVRTGQPDGARALLQRTLAGTTSASMLSQLYGVDRQCSLGQANAIMDRAQSANLLTPSLVFRRALDLSADGDPQTALAATRGQAEAHPNELAWSLVDAQLRTRLNDRTAAAAWAGLLEAHGDDLRVLTAAIDENAPLAGGRPAMAELIERLNALSGGDASGTTGYRLRRARFLSTSADPQDVREALATANALVREQPNRPELRVLLAKTLVSLDNANTAIEHLRAAHEQAPNDAAIGLELVTLLQREGRLDDAVRVLRQVAAGSPIDGSALRNRVGATLLDAGLPDIAAEMLSRAGARRPLDRAGQLMLADALRASGDLVAAGAAYRSLVADPNAAPAALASAAAFARSGGQAKDADALLARLGSLPASSERAMALARYHATFGDRDGARAAYADALPQATDASLASEAIAFELTYNGYDRADAILSAAEAKYANDPTLKRLRLELAARRDAGTSPDALAALAASLAADPATRGEADALEALRAARSTGAATPALAEALTRLAERHRNAVELARLAIDANLAAGKPDAAGALASRLALDQPTRADAQACAARALLACRQFPQAQRAAERWRSLDGSAAREADATLAGIALEQRDGPRALALLLPYQASIDTTRDADEFAACTFARALAANGRAAEGFGLLANGLRTRPAFRAAWRSIANDPATAVGRLAELQKATPTVAADAERLQLARACATLASNGVDGAAAVGLAAVEPVSATPATRVLRGELQRMSGDLVAAEATFREAIRVSPQDPTAKNSLAFVLICGPNVSAQRANEAAELARAAAAALPNQADVRDTLARAEWAAGRTDQAVRSFRDALRLEPDCLDAMVGLAALNLATGKTADADAMMPAIQQRLANATVPLHLRRDVQSLRLALTTARD